MEMPKGVTLVSFRNRHSSMTKVPLTFESVSNEISNILDSYTLVEIASRQNARFMATTEILGGPRFRWMHALLPQPSHDVRVEINLCGWMKDTRRYAPGQCLGLLSAARIAIDTD